MREFQWDFEMLSGMRLAFVDELGYGEELAGESALCVAVQASEAGRALCARTRHGLMAAGGDAVACAVCDAGLSESVVPLKVGGIRAGSFVFCGSRPVPMGHAMVQRVRHLLRKNGVGVDAEALEGLLGEAREVSGEELGAWQRMVERVARQIALRVTDQMAEPAGVMPVAVQKACGYIRAQALVEDIDLGGVARYCGVSQGHLSRVFHHSTGLTFREYVTQVRLEHARGLLRRSAKSVTEIAYDSGFQSLSQFHRAFLKAFGVSPGRLRAGGAGR